MPVNRRACHIQSRQILHDDVPCPAGTDREREVTRDLVGRLYHNVDGGDYGLGSPGDLFLRELDSGNRVVEQLGFTYVALDLRGYRRGSLNEAV